MPGYCVSHSSSELLCELCGKPVFVIRMSCNIRHLCEAGLSVVMTWIRSSPVLFAVMLFHTCEMWENYHCYSIINLKVAFNITESPTTTGEEVVSSLKRLMNGTAACFTDSVKLM